MASVKAQHAQDLIRSLNGSQRLRVKFGAVAETVEREAQR